MLTKLLEQNEQTTCLITGLDKETTMLGPTQG